MAEYLPLLIVGGIIGAFTLVFLLAFLTTKRKKAVSEEFERHMSDKAIVLRLLQYTKPYWKDFLLVFFIMLLSIGHNILSPLLVGRIEELVKGKFELSCENRCYDGVCLWT